jgi:hypothetical protein
MLRPFNPEKILGTYCREGWVDSRASLEGYEEEKINYSTPRFESRTVHPVGNDCANYELLIYEYVIYNVCVCVYYNCNLKNKMH